MAFPLKYPWSQTNCKLESLESYESSFDNLHISQERHINKAGNVEENRNGTNPGSESKLKLSVLKMIVLSLNGSVPVMSF